MKRILFFLGAIGITALLIAGSSNQSNATINTNSVILNTVEKINNPVVNEQIKIQPVKVDTANSGLSNNNYYQNSAGNTVHSPAYELKENTIPVGASALCGDGTYSFSQSRRGTCSHHGGVAEWL